MTTNADTANASAGGDAGTTGDTSDKDTTTTTTATTGGDTTDWKAEAEKWKGLSRKHEDRAKENADKATKYDEIQDENRSDLDKATGKAAEMETRATTAELTAMRLDVALDKAPEGMSVAQIRKLAKRLHGKTRDELEADANELFADFKPGTGDETDEEETGKEGDTPPGRPRELRTGTTGDTKAEQNDPRELAKRLPSTA